MRRAAPTWPICDEMLMIEPGRLAATRRPATACATKNAARTLSPMMTSKSSTVTSGSIFGRLVPALLIEHVERLGFRHRRPDRRDVGDVESKCVGLIATRTDRLGRRLDLACRARRERDVCAGCGQRGCGREPDAAPAARHQRALAVEPERRRFRRGRFLPWDS